MNKITIRKADGTWTVRAGGAILAESRNALELTEGTVKVHLGAIFRALHVTNRTSAAMLCASVGMEESPHPFASA